MNGDNITILVGPWHEETLALDWLDSWTRILTDSTLVSFPSLSLVDLKFGLRADFQ